MTPFMRAVADLLDGEGRRDVPQIVPSVAKPIGEGTDHQVALRSLAEQYVAEANAVLAAGGEHIELRDEAGSDRLCFTLRCGGRSTTSATRRCG